MDSGTGNSGRSSSDGNDGSCDSRAAADSLFIPNPAPPLPTYNNSLLYHNSINPDTPLPVTTQNMTTAESTMVHQQPSLQPPPPSTAARNPKKRSRVSRRAPTTVLTTDTTNFRSMVQEFTGIPSTPFCNNNNTSAVTPSLSARARLDLFRSTALIPSRATSAYLSHRFPQKNQPSTITDTDLVVNNHTVDDSRNSCNISFPFGTDNYQQPISSQALGLHSVATNPLLSSLLQRTTSTDDMHHGSDHVLRMMNGSDHDFTLGHGETFSYDQTLLGLPSLVSTDQVTSLRNNGGHISTDPDHGGDDNEADDHLVRPMKMAKYDNCDSRNCLVGEKGLEDVVATRSEGMFESWIRSSE